MNCPKCGAELKARVIHDALDGDLNFALCPDCPYCMGIPQPPLEEVYRDREKLRVAMGRVW